MNHIYCSSLLVEDLWYQHVLKWHFSLTRIKRKKLFCGQNLRRELVFFPFSFTFLPCCCDIRQDQCSFLAEDTGMVGRFPLCWPGHCHCSWLEDILCFSQVGSLVWRREFRIRKELWICKVGTYSCQPLYFIHIPALSPGESQICHKPILEREMFALLSFHPFSEICSLQYVDPWKVSTL